jgi:hypothetical protein
VKTAVVFLGIIFVGVSFFYNIALVEAAYTPPFYCMALGDGTDCPGIVPSGQPAPSAYINLQGTDQPCSPNKPKGFFASLFGFFIAFFKSAQDEPCSPSSSSSIPQASSQPSVSSALSQSIQLIDRKVSQVGGKEMFIKTPKLENAQPGDILVAVIGSDYAHVSGVPAGWVQIRQDVKNTGHKDDLALQSYYKIVTTNEEASYTWNMVTARNDTPSDHQPLIAVDM